MVSSWVLVFWLSTPGNYTQYEVYKTRLECIDAEQGWNRRFRIVKSELQAECREREVVNGTIKSESLR